MELFGDQYLPALQQYNRLLCNSFVYKEKYVYRTLYVNGFQITINLKLSTDDTYNTLNENNKNNENDEINLILVDDYDCLKTNDNIYNTNCILVKLANKKDNNKFKLLSREYNIPYIFIKEKSEKCINDLIMFSVKYHWFQTNNHL